MEKNVSYAIGGYPTIELLKNKINFVRKVYLSTNLNKNDEYLKLMALINKHKIAVEYNDKFIKKIAKKDNVYVMAEFEKYQCKVDFSKNIICLVSPQDSGNLGTIIRTMLGFDYTNLAIISPAVDILNEKCIRSSMGAVFNVNFEYFSNFEGFKEKNKNEIFCFMLSGRNSLQTISYIPNHTLVFGNEASGLNDDFENFGTSIKINQTNKIDSLNLSMSVGIAMYQFSKENFK